MAGNREFKTTITFDAKMNIDQIKGSLNQLRNNINNSFKLDNSLKNKYDNLFDGALKELQEFERLSSKGITNKKDADEVSRQWKKVETALERLSMGVKGIKGIDAKKLIPSETLQKINSLKDKWNELQKKFNERTTNKNNIKSNLDEAKRALEELERNQKNFENSKPTKQTEEYKKLAQAAADAAKEVDRLEKEQKEIKANPNATKSEKNSAKTALDLASKEQDKAEKAVAKYEQRIREAEIESENYAESIRKQTEEVVELTAEWDKIKHITTAPEGFKALRQELANLLGQDIEQIPNKMSEVEKILNNLQADQLAIVRENIEKLNPDLDNLEKHKQGIHDMNREFQQSADEANNFANQMNGLQQQFINFFSLQNGWELLKRAIRSAYDTVKELDKAMTEIAVVSDYNLEDIWSMRQEFSDSATSMGVATLDLVEATTLYVQQGLDLNEAMGVATETMKMGRIAGLDGAEATNLMTAALRGYNMEMEQAAHVNDVYSQLAAKTASDTEELAIAMSKTASIAYNSGASFENMSAFLAQIIETTREAPETAGTAMKTIIARFQELKKPLEEIGEVEGEVVDANKIEGALRLAGVALRDAKGEFRDFDDVILELSGKWDTLDKMTQRYIATQAAGSRQQSRFLALLDNNARLTELTGYAANSAGAANQQFAKTLDSMESKLNKLQNALKLFWTGLANNKIIKGAITLLTGFMNAINAILKPLTQSKNVFANVIGSILQLTLVITAGKLALKALKGGFDHLSKAMGRNTAVSRENNQEQAKGSASIVTKLTALIASAGAYNKETAAKALSAKIGNLSIVQRAKEYGQLLKVAGALILYKLGILDAARAQALGVAIDMTRLKEKEQMILNSGLFIASLIAEGHAEEAINHMVELGIPLKQAQAIATKMAAGATFEEALAMTSLKGAISTALPYIAAFAAAIAAAVIIFTLISKAIHADENALEDLNASLDQTAKGMQDTSQAISDVASKKEEIAGYEDTLSTLTKGTLEWKKALLDVNSAVLELINTYPILQDYVTRTEDGMMQISDEGWEALDDQLAARLEFYQGANTVAQIQKNDLTTKMNRKEDSESGAYQDAYGKNYSNEFLEAVAKSGALAGDEENLDELKQLFKEWGYVFPGYLAAGSQYFSEEAAENFNKRVNEAFSNEINNENLIDSELRSIIQDDADLANSRNVEILEARALNIDNDEFLKRVQAEENNLSVGGILRQRDLRKQYAEQTGLTPKEVKEMIKNDELDYNTIRKALATQKVKADIKDDLKETNKNLSELGPLNEEQKAALNAIYNDGLSLTQSDLEALKNINDEDLYKILEATNTTKEDYERNVQNAQEMWDSENWAKAIKEVNPTLPVTEIMESFENEISSSLDLNLDQLQGFSNVMADIEEKGGRGAAVMREYSKILSNANLNEQELQEVLDLMSKTTFKTSQDVFDFQKNLKAMGVTIPNDQMKTLIGLLGELQAVDFESLKNGIEESQNLIEDIQNRDSDDLEFSQEEVDKLMEAGANRADFVWDGNSYTYIAGNLDQLVLLLQESNLLQLQTNADLISEQIRQGENIANLVNEDEDFSMLVSYINEGLEWDQISNKYTAEDLENYALEIGLSEEQIAGLSPDALYTLISNSIENGYGLAGEKLESNKRTQEILVQDTIDYAAQTGDVDAALETTKKANQIAKTSEEDDDSSKKSAERIVQLKQELKQEEEVEKTLNRIIKVRGLDEKAIEEETKAIKANNKALSSSQAKEQAVKQAILDKKYEDVLDSIVDLNKAMEDGTDSTKDYLKVAEGITDIFGVDVDEKWVKEHIEDLQALAAGGDEAINAWRRIKEELMEDAKGKIILELEEKGTENLPQIRNELNNLEQDILDLDGTGFTVTGEADCSQLMEELLNAGYTAEEAMAYIEGFTGLTVEPYTEDVSFELGSVNVGNLGKAFVESLYAQLPGNIVRELFGIPTGLVSGASNLVTSLGSTNVKQVKYRVVGKKGLKNSIDNFTPTHISSGSNGNSGGSNGGGGNSSSGKSSEKWKPNYDWLFNVQQKINTLIQKRNKLEETHNKLLENAKNDYKEILKNNKEQIKNLNEQNKKQQSIINGRQNQIQNILSKGITSVGGAHINLKNAISYDPETNELQYKKIKEGPKKGQLVLNSWRNKYSAETGQLIEEAISKIESFAGDVGSALDAIGTNTEQIRELQKAGREELISFENDLVDALYNQEKARIDKLKEINDSIYSASQDMISGLKEGIEDYRQKREQDEKKKELEDKEQRLAVMLSDTSGANQLDILSLQDEIKNDRQGFTDELIDNNIEAMEKQAQEAHDQREKTINLQYEHLDYLKESGQLAKKADNLITEAQWSRKVQERIENLLKTENNYSMMGKANRSQWSQEFATRFEQALVGLNNRGGSKVTIGKAGKKVSFTNAAGKKVTGTWTSSGKIASNGRLYSDLVDAKPFDSSSNPIRSTTESAIVSKAFLKNFAAAAKLGKTGFNKDGKGTENIKKYFGQEGYNTYIGYLKNMTEAQAKKIYNALSDSDKNRMKLSYWKNYYGYATGGLADFTGPAWLDGTKANPEYVLSADQTRAFFRLIDVAESIDNKKSTSNGDVYLNVNMENSISSDYDVDSMWEEMQNKITEAADYRNVNLLGFGRR